jgi:oxygen-independent coproporphyrinogen-3 oxidase
MYDALIDRSAAAGFRQYEIANFARDRRATASDPAGEPATSPGGAAAIPTFACRHNTGYWRGRDYFGIGPSASEAVNGVRARNWSNTTFWIEEVERGRRARELNETLSPLKRAGELAAFGLRMNAGWPFAEFRTRTGMELREEWRTELDTLVARGWAEETPEVFRLNRTGLRFADTAAGLMLR